MRKHRMVTLAIGTLSLMALVVGIAGGPWVQVLDGLLIAGLRLDQLALHAHTSLLYSRYSHALLDAALRCRR